MLKLVHAFDMKIKNVKDYYDSFNDKWHDLNCFAICMVKYGSQSYIEHLKLYEKNLYFLVDEDNPDYIIGYGSIENSCDYHKKYLNIGNIGYGIRPLERKKGYGTILLKLLLKECEKLGMNEVCVSCLKDNIASNNVIKNNNGKLEKEFMDDESGKIGLKYWINLRSENMSKIKKISRD